MKTPMALVISELLYDRVQFRGLRATTRRNQTQKAYAAMSIGVDSKTITTA